MAQPIDLPKVRDDKVAKINISINQREADNATVIPKGIIKNVKNQVDDLDFLVCLVVLTIKSTVRSYQILLGRPWLKEAKVKHD